MHQERGGGGGRIIYATHITTKGSKVSFTACVQYRTCALCQCCNCIQEGYRREASVPCVRQGASSEIIWVNWEHVEVEGFRKLAANYSVAISCALCSSSCAICSRFVCLQMACNFSVSGLCVRAEGAFGDIIWVNCGQLETANSKQVCCSRFVCVRRVHSVTRHVVIDTPVPLQCLDITHLS